MQKTIHFFKQFPYATLLLVQLVSIIFYGFTDYSHTNQLLFNAIGLVVPLLAVWVVYRTPAINWVAFLLAAPAIFCSIYDGISGQFQLMVWAHIFESLLYFYAASSLVMYMFADDVVTLDELFAAAATFTLLVWAFALAYSACQQIYPGSILAALNPSAPRSWTELLFMSFSIQSSTGVGDVIPVSSPARAIASLQIFTGVMYIAIVISRLVGLAAISKK